MKRCDPTSIIAVLAAVTGLLSATVLGSSALETQQKNASESGTTTNYDLRVTSDYCQKTLAKVDQIISKNIYSAQLAKNDWPKAKAEFSKKIIESKTLMELDDSINAAIKKLHSSHCQFVTTNDETYYFLNALFSRFNKKLTDTKMDYTGVICGGGGLPFNQVRYIVDGSPGEAAKFHVGDKIWTVSGEPYVGQANFFKTASKKVPVVVDRGGTRVDVTVTPILKDPFTAYCQACAKSVRIIDAPEGKIGYVHLWAGGSEAQDVLEEMLATRLADTDGLILDMRDGYGGNSITDLDFFYRNPAGYPVFTMKGRDGRKTGSKMFYDKPMVALINGGSRSGKELLAFSLKQSGRAKVIGDKTAGFVLGGRVFPIDDRCALYLAVADAEVAGTRLEGMGVEPDVSIPNPDFSEAAANAQLDKAKELLLSLLKKPLNKPATD